MARSKDSPAFAAFLEKEHDRYAQFLENSSREAEIYEPKSFRELYVSRDVMWPLESQGSITKPTPIQTLAIPRIRRGKDVVVRANPGSGKTLSYLLWLAEGSLGDSSRRPHPFAMIILPTEELCHKVHGELKQLVEICALELKAHLMTTTSSLPERLSGSADVVFSTPAGLVSCSERSILQKSLQILVLDEVDLHLSLGFEVYLNSFIAGVTKSCQCLIVSANPSSDVKKLRSLVLHNPYVATLTEDEHLKAELFPYNFEHFYLPCEEDDKLYFLPHAFESLLIRKVLIFTNSDDTSSKIQLFLEKFEYTCSVLLGDWTEDSQELENFNAGDSDLLIATDNQSASKQPMGMFTYGIFKNVDTVVHFDMPQNAYGYHGRILSTTRPAFEIGESVAMPCPGDKDVFEAIKTSLGEDGKLNTKFLVPAPSCGWLEDTGVEGPLWSFKEVESAMYGP